jgi:hypothetical protein
MKGDAQRHARAGRVDWRSEAFNCGPGHGDDRHVWQARAQFPVGQFEATSRAVKLPADAILDLGDGLRRMCAVPSERLLP